MFTEKSSKYNEKDDIMNEEARIPQKYKILSGSMLKVIALVTMLIDHTTAAIIGSMITDIYDTSDKYVIMYNILRGIGRIAFPIYAFLLTEGYVHTHDRKKYGISLLIFAAVSEIPWNLCHAGTVRWENQNVFFTLFLGYLGICLYEKYKSSIIKVTACLVPIFVVTLFLKADYGCTGFCFILMVYILRDKPFIRAIIGSGLLSSTWKAGCAFIPIALYNGKRGFIKGKILKYLFYIIYPAHMLLLYFIKNKYFGY